MPFVFLTSNVAWRCICSLCATIVEMIRAFPSFNAYGALAVTLFGTANMLNMSILNILGMALTLNFNGSIQIIVGWVSGRFGISDQHLNCQRVIYWNFLASIRADMLVQFSLQQNVS